MSPLRVVQAGWPHIGVARDRESMVARDDERGVIGAVSGRSSHLSVTAISAGAWMELSFPRTGSIGGERGAICVRLAPRARRGTAIAR